LLGVERTGRIADKLIGEVASHLQRAERVLFITGAGISADSGLPTYRGVGGLYDDVLTDDELPIEVALSGTMLRARPVLTWKYVLEIEKACRGAAPNRGHELIAAIEKQKPETWVLTQNIDGFHRRAGSQNLIEIHGHLLDLQCTLCDWEEEVANFSHLALPPKCMRCNGPIRPDVVFFGEMLPEEKIEKLYREMERGFDMVFSVGTTSVFPYISEPVLTARRAGVPTVEINPGETDISELGDYRLRMGAAEAMAALVD
jgi:NAD-dependent deacetylase